MIMEVLGVHSDFVVGWVSLVMFKDLSFSLNVICRLYRNEDLTLELSACHQFQKQKDKNFKKRVAELLVLASVGSNSLDSR